MNKRQVLTFIQRNPVFDLATADDNIPHVRAMTLFRADQEGLIFVTRRSKDLYRQLSANPHVELCFNSGSAPRQIRISGTVELLEDLGIKKEVVEFYPYLRPLIRTEGYQALAIFRLPHGQATEWPTQTNTQTKAYVEL